GKYAYFVDQNSANFDEVLLDVTIIDIETFEDSKIMDSPVESGILISDHRINNPIEITVNCTLPRDSWENAYKELRY
ncbi:phage baseplate protein, partial [Pseudomonas syringae]|uniref:phage baseplate protein n=1 Tax=Pseudomonas syringae TaxID=317 RepID=UPI0034D6B012